MNFPPTTTAADTESGRPADAVEFGVRNTELFTRRQEIVARLAELNAADPAETSVLARRRRSRLIAELDQVTTEIVRLNYGLVRDYTRRFTSKSSREDSADFEAAATLGLMKAISTFDPSKGKFGAWAYKPIQREVLKAVRDADFKSMNTGDFERRPDILRAWAKLQAGDETVVPAYAEVARVANVTVDQVRRVLEAPRLDSLHTHVGDDGETELGDLVESGDLSVEATVVAGLTLTALELYGIAALDARELLVLCRRYGLDGEPVQKLQSIGTMLHLSREAVRQIESKGLAKLIHPCVLRRIHRHGRP